MAAGYISNGQCVQNLNMAAQLFCAEFPKQVATGTTPVTYTCAVNGTAGGVILQPISGATAGTAYTVAPTYSTCDTDTFPSPVKVGQDIIPVVNTIFTAALGASAVIWGLRKVYERLWGESQRM